MFAVRRCQIVVVAMKWQTLVLPFVPLVLVDDTSSQRYLSHAKPALEAGY
jgi:hypothetical protein